MTQSASEGEEFCEYFAQRGDDADLDSDVHISSPVIYKIRQLIELEFE